MFIDLGRFLDALCLEWKRKLISMSTDGGRSMVSCVHGVATRTEAVAKPGFVRAWCGLRWVDLVMQRIFKSLKEDQICKGLKGIILYLRRQTLLIEKMKGKCKKIADKVWLSTGRVANWFTKNRVAPCQLFENKNPPSKPSTTLGDSLGSDSNLDGGERRHRKSARPRYPYTRAGEGSVGIVRQVCKLADIEGPLSEGDLKRRRAAATHITAGNFSVSYSNTVGFFNDLGSDEIGYM